ncbi:MAG: hypothetical protein RIC87_24145 [Kiloniellales bacterium]
MLRYVTVLAMLIALSGCGSSQEAPALKDERQAYDDGLAALAVYETEASCSTTALNDAVLNVNRLQHLLRLYQQRREQARLAATVAYHQDLSLAIAGVAIGKNCLEPAEYFYRKIIAVYPGTKYEPVRRRAEIGLTNVLNARDAQ